MTNLLIIGGSLIVMALLGLSPAIRPWWAALRIRTVPSLVMIGAMAAPFIGGTAYDTSSLLPDQTRLIRLVILLSIFTISVSSALKKTSLHRHAGKGAQWMIVYSVFAMLSAIYSLSPFLSFWKGFEVFVLVMAAVYISKYLRSLDDLQWLLDLLGLMLLFLTVTVLMGFIVDPTSAIRAGSEINPSEMTTTVRGVIGSINPSSVGGLGAMTMMLAFSQIFERRARGRWALWLIVAMGMVTMYLAHSRTAIFGAMAAIMAILIFYRRAGLALSIGAITSLVLFTALGDTVLAYIYRGQSEELFLSMSGRTYYWGLFAERIMEAPLLGHGFYAGIRTLFGTSSTDNSYIGVLLDLGVAGLILFVIPILVLAWTLWCTRPRRAMPWAGDILWLRLAGVFVIVLLRSPVSTSFQILHHLLVVYMILQVGSAAYYRLRHDARLAYLHQTKHVDGDPHPGSGKALRANTRWIRQVGT